MLRTKIPTQSPGVYLYRAGKQVYIDEVGRELIIVLTAPQQGMCGVIVYPDSFVRGQLFELLASVKDKFCKELSLEASTISAKIFGCSNGQTNALFAAQVWLTDKGIKIEALDTGRNVTRNMVIDCKSGKVGVRFADAENALGMGFLKNGSATQRFGTTPTDAQEGTEVVERKAILVTDNKSFAMLGSQSLEGQPGWKVSILSGKDLIKAPKKLRLAWLKTTAIVIVLEDVLETAKLAPSIIALRKKAPAIRWLWSVSDGTEVPLPLESIHLPNGASPQDFGREVATSFTQAPVRTGTVLSLIPKRKNKR